MTKTYLLIDLENRQPDPAHVAAWIGSTGEAWIFYGEHQIGLLPSYWEIGDQVTIVPISRPGKNSLDFHLVLYLGYLVAKQKKKARFVIVADDADYDPAVSHARGEGVDVVRVSDLTMPLSVNGYDIGSAVPLPATKDRAKQPASGKSATAKTEAPAPCSSAKASPRTTIAIYAGILNDIRGSNKPGNKDALRSRIQSRIGHESAPEKVAAVVARLETMDVIKFVDGELTYLPGANSAVSTRN